MDFEREEERDLTTCESMIMKAVWDSKEDLSTKELMEILRSRFGKDYAATTVRTFLVKLSDKGFIRTYRVKKNAYIHPMKSEEAYKALQIQKQTEFWYNGSASDLICAAVLASKITKEDLEKIRGMLDDWDYELDG